MIAPRFGFFFWPWSPEYTARMASLGEDGGWDLVGIADTPGNAMDPWVALTLAATRTERVGLAVRDGAWRSSTAGGPDGESAR